MTEWDGNSHEVTLLTRAGCGACVGAWAELVAVCAEFAVTPTQLDVDDVAASQPDLRAEFGDRLPVVLLDGREHSYWDVDVERLRADLRK
ncbi:glutaredoxin family protein [Rhodococcus triatomae]|uniref:Glutaredoxin-like domain n=1 Tax=Rhodococcus triatomae TaxID=300028 RepID=A0A1G8J5W1_9NOCA|nr:glutaredoxin family protein [Rhodococcus triatomae]QNG19809.1 glutaredoxin family protein [Rhodococcus triatomae]QNG24275.1 glutaredoxin family protein [Rhodococcus triatomae]SDI26472.1 Glutaredoxin-like domain [Rhodococcus triatomae]